MNLAHTMRWLVCLVAIAALIAGGCATGGQSTAAGAGIGALTGGVIGSLSGRAWEGAAIGAAVGALGGYIVHDARSRRTATPQETYETYEYKPEQGFTLDIRSMTVQPGSVPRGGRATTTIEYATLGTGAGTDISEVILLMKDGKTESTLWRKAIARTDGTWQNQIEFEVPRDVEPGTYILVHDISSRGLSRTAQTSFDVQS